MTETMHRFYNNQRLTHLSQMEAFLWVKFLQEHLVEPATFEYDVHLRKPVKLPSDMPENYKSMATHLSSLRIDVIMRTKYEMTIIELRPRAKQGTLGTVIMYRYLYMLQYNPTLPVRMMIVTDTYEPAMELTTRQLEIAYIVV